MINISLLKKGDDIYPGHCVQFKGQVKDRYYNNEEYCQSTNKQKDQLHNMHKDRGHQSKKRKRNDCAGRLTEKIKKIAVTTIAEHEQNKGNDPLSTVPEEGNDNCNNPDLTRQLRNGN